MILGRRSRSGGMDSLVSRKKVNSSPWCSRSSRAIPLWAVPINLHRPIPEGCTVKQVRVLSRVRGTQWYVVVTIESDVSVPATPVQGRAIGIDLGLERFLTVSDGSFQERPKFFKALQSKLKLLQRRAARKRKGSQNWEKAQLKVSRLHHRIANRRKDFHLKTAHKLCDQAHCLAMVRKGLAVREHHCPECGYRTHRDHASAEMVLLRGIEQVVAQGRWGKETACQVGLSLDKWRGAGIPNREVGRA
jgi:putative transposase